MVLGRWTGYLLGEGKQLEGGPLKDGMFATLCPRCFRGLLFLCLLWAVLLSGTVDKTNLVQASYFEYGVTSKRRSHQHFIHLHLPVSQLALLKRSHRCQARSGGMAPRSASHVKVEPQSSMRRSDLHLTALLVQLYLLSFPKLNTST
jgi:hypothetical protein